MMDNTRHTEVLRGAGGWPRRFAVLGGWFALLGASICCMNLVAVAEEPTGDAATASSADDLTPVRLLDDIEATGREKLARLNRIRLQLQKLAEASRHADSSHAPAIPVDPAPASELPPEPQTDTHVAESESLPPDLHAVPVPPEEHAPEHSTAPDAGHEEPHAPVAHDPGHKHGAPADAHHADPQPHTTETVVGASIDRIALADSLFGTGQSDLALQTYNSVDLLKQPVADRYWIEYQVANCHRRLGDLAEAEQRYRRLAGLVDAGWCAVHARWWLDALKTRASLQRDLESVRISLKTVEEQLNAKPQQ